MRRTVKGKTSFSESFLEKFSMIYMEVQDLDGDVPPKRTLWHLEDEQRKVIALCGRTLHGVCKSVSPALAMLGTPCPACIKIVRKWLTAKQETTRKYRMGALVKSDVNFRNQVMNNVSPELFIAEFVGADHSEENHARLVGKRSNR